jgi:universal stress protein E
MIIKTTFRHSKTRRVLFKSSDWNLMRHSPCPVLLVKNDKPWPTASRVFAALDLESLDAAHARLNNSVFVAAKRMAAASGMELGIVSAFKKKPENVLVCDADATPESLLAERYGVAPEQVVLSKGAAVKVLSKLVASQNVPLLVIGTIARAGMAGVLVGNTAEKILDKIETDILVLS